MFHITADSKCHSYFTVSNAKLQGNEKGENGSERELKMLHDQFIMENFERGNKQSVNTDLSLLTDSSVECSLHTLHINNRTAEKH